MSAFARRQVTGAAAIALVLAASSCFYDSRWGESGRRQRAAAQHATPSTLAATPEEGAEGQRPKAPERVLRVRAHATPLYVTEVTDWKRRLDELFEDANAVFGPTVSARLELVSAEPWRPKAGDDDLSKLSDELEAIDPGEGVDRVVGLAGAVPHYELTFSQLGLGHKLGKHLVIRAMNDARDYEAIQRTLPDLEEQERSQLYRARRRHKTTTVFLHELAHTLGVPHELDRHSIMAPRYDSKSTGFSLAAAQLMRLTVAHRLDPGAQTEEAFAQAFVDHLKRTSSTWVPTERDAEIARLEAALAMRARPPAGPAAPPASAAAAAATSAVELAALTEPDRAIFAQASEHLRAGRTDDAWNKAQALVSSYPTVYAVQDLRCQIAMKRGLAWKAVQAECEPLMRLVPGTAPPRAR